MKITQLLCASLLALAAGAASAHGDVKCETPKAEWKPQMELQAKLKNEGWRVRKVQVFNGCYEVYGFDAKGERTEAFFDPKTFERIEPKS
ncbi:MAG: PepSY domain-containing protein [Rhizobacter sp.]